MAKIMIQYDGAMIRINFPDGEGCGAELGDAIAKAIRAIDPPRMCQVISEIVTSMIRHEKFISSPVYFSGHGTALEKLCEGAREITRGWQETDNPRDTK